MTGAGGCMSEDRLDYLLRLQAELQAHHGDNMNMKTDAQLVQYIKDMTIACTDELHEALAEVYWKPWAAMPPGFKDRDAYVGELIDALHFVFNLMLAARVTSDELIARYVDKNSVNHGRIDSGYTGTDKCDGPECSRALDEPSILPGTIIQWQTGERFCSVACETAAKAEA